MKVCFVSNEYPGFGLRGGFGVLTRDLAEGLRDEGVETCVLVPKSPKVEQRTIEYINGIQVIGVPRDNLKKFFASHLYKLPKADIYHSEEILVDSYFVVKNNPKAKHVVTFQDPPLFDELWSLEVLRGKGGVLRKLKLRLKYEMRKRIIMRAIKEMDAYFAEAKFLIEKAKKMFNIREEIKFLPNPIRMPKERIRKASEPTVCFLGRWDVQKRPWIFLELAREFPDVNFIAMGKGQENEDLDRKLRLKYRKVKNLRMTGYVSEEEKKKFLNESWILVSTSIREGLPIAFLEALSRRCALLSYVNPDDLARKYGYWAREEDFGEGLRWLLEKNRWRKLGKRGQEYVKRTHAYEKVIRLHLKIYKRLLK